MLDIRPSWWIRVFVVLETDMNPASVTKRFILGRHIRTGAVPEPTNWARVRRGTVQWERLCAGSLALLSLVTQAGHPPKIRDRFPRKKPTNRGASALETTD